MARDYLKEAFQIYEGKSKLKPRKEHLAAVIHRLEEMAKKTHKLALTMQAAVLKAEKKKNQNQGDQNEVSTFNAESDNQ